MWDFYYKTALEYGIYDTNTDDFDVVFHFYLYLFLSIFFPVWWGLMSGVIKWVYQLPLMILIFAGIWYHVETVRFGFYLASIIMTIAFIFMIATVPYYRNQFSFLSKFKKAKNAKFKLTAIERTWTLVKIATDYSVRINKVPGQRAIYSVDHPLTGMQTEVQTPISFGNNIQNAPHKLSIYFDRHNPEKYLCEFED